MALEIERKFLLANEDWRPAATHSETLWQGYLTTNERCSVRVRVAGDLGYLNIKSTTLGVVRHEFEYAVPVAEARELLTLFCDGRSLGKTRYHVPVGAHLWEIDVFEGENAGLIVAEVELSAEDEEFERPSWLGEEVSADPRYYNTSLIAHPYARWARS